MPTIRKCRPNVSVELGSLKNSPLSPPIFTTLSDHLHPAVKINSVMAHRLAVIAL